MTNIPQEDRQTHLIACRAAVDRARQSADDRQLSLALIDLGAALFQTKVFDQGVAALDEAGQLASALDDQPFLARCLGLKAAVYQDAGRFHDAYEVIEQAVDMAQAQGNLAMKCDAIITQSQILANSGDPIAALEKMQAAHALAHEVDDKRHLMKVFGALGAIETSRAALDSAQAYFELAAAWAAKLGDKRAECGYLLNLGTVFHWQGLVTEGLRASEHALAVAQEIGERDAELAALQHIIQCLQALKTPERIIPLAQQGITRAQEQERHDLTFSFWEAEALAHYQLGEQTEALEVLQQAVKYARLVGNPNHEADMLLHLGESYIAMELYAEALPLFEDASKILDRLSRETDSAHLLGRLGVILAELGRIDEAIPYHQRAVELARQHNLVELEAEQMVMLALAYRDQHDLERAQQYCSGAAEIFSAAGLQTEASHARQLLAEVSVL